MDVSTPALLFGSISLLLLAFTNRFFVIAKLIRDLHEREADMEMEVVQMQIPILRKRLQFIKHMQTYGVASFILCTASLFSLFLNYDLAGKLFFALSVLALILSLVFALREIFASTRALDILLDRTKSDSNTNRKKKKRAKR